MYDDDGGGGEVDVGEVGSGDSCCCSMFVVGEFFWVPLLCSQD